MKLVIGNKNYSSWSLRPWMLLTSFNLPFTEIKVALDRSDFKQQLQRYSDAAKVPVLIDDGQTVWDSLAICETISERYLDGRGWPSDSSQRAIARALCAEIHSGFSALREALPMNCRATREVIMNAQVQQEIARIDAIWSNYASLNENGEQWLFGQFSIADCFFAPVVLRFRTYGIPLSDAAQAYADSVIASSGIQRWLEQAAKETEVIAADEAGF